MSRKMFLVLLLSVLLVALMGCHGSSATTAPPAASPAATQAATPTAAPQKSPTPTPTPTPTPQITLRLPFDPQEDLNARAYEAYLMTELDIRPKSFCTILETRWEAVTSPMQLSFWRDFATDVEVPKDFLALSGFRADGLVGLDVERQTTPFTFYRAHGETHFWNTAFPPAWQQVSAEQGAAILNRYWANDLLGLINRMHAKVVDEEEGLKLILSLPKEEGAEKIVLPWLTNCDEMQSYAGTIQRLSGYGKANANAKGVLTSAKLSFKGEYLPQGESTPLTFYLTLTFNVTEGSENTTIDLYQTNPRNSSNILSLPMPTQSQWRYQEGDPLVGFLAEYWVKGTLKNTVAFFRQEWPRQGFTLTEEKQVDDYSTNELVLTFRDANNRPLEARLHPMSGDPGTTIVKVKAAGGIFTFTPTVESNASEGFSGAFCRVWGGQPQENGACQWPDGNSCTFTDLWQVNACKPLDERPWTLLDAPYLYCLMHGGTPEYAQEGDNAVRLCRFPGKDAYCNAWDYMNETCQRGGSAAQPLPITLQQYTAEVKGHVAAGDVVRYTMPHPEYPPALWSMSSNGGGAAFPLFPDQVVFWLESTADDLRADVYHANNRLADRAWANAAPGAISISNDTEEPLIEIIGGEQDADFTLRIGWAVGLPESNGVNTISDKLDSKGLRFYTQYTTSGRLNVSLTDNVVLGVYQLSPATDEWVLLSPEDNRKDFAMEGDPDTWMLFIIQGTPNTPFTLTSRTYLP